MDTKIIDKFIDENNEELVSDYYDKIYHKLIELNTRSMKLLRNIIIIILIFFISSKSSFDSISIGPISLKNFSIVVIISPVLFSFFIYEYLITSTHREDVKFVLKYLSTKRYKQSISHKDVLFERLNNLIILVIPFSISNEILYSKKAKVVGWKLIYMIILLILTLLVVVITPIYMISIMLYEVYINYFNQTIGVLSFIITIFILLFIVAAFFNSSRDDLSEL